jgi:hypothetical protein
LLTSQRQKKMKTNQNENELQKQKKSESRVEKIGTSATLNMSSDDQDPTCRNCRD